MASVQYYVLYKYAHPTTKKPITNTTAEKYDQTTKFVKAYDPENIDTTTILEQKSPENQKYDMLFMYNGIYELNTLIAEAIADAPGSGQYRVMVEKFDRCKGEAWFVASVHSSLQSAMKAATPIAKSMGKENVKVVKNVPIDIEVTLE